MSYFIQFWSCEILYLCQPNFSQPLALPTTQHLDYDVIDDLPVEGPIGIHQGLLDENKGLQDETLLDEALLVDPLGCRWKVPLSWTHNPCVDILLGPIRSIDP